MNPRRRLAQLLGMLGSRHDGEILNAAKAAQRQLGAIGLTWEELLNSTTGHSDEVLASAYQEGFASGYRKGLADAAANTIRRQTWTTFAHELNQNHWQLLNEWEQGFVENFVEHGWPTPTPKQQAVFERIAQKLGLELPN